MTGLSWLSPLLPLRPKSIPSKAKIGISFSGIRMSVSWEFRLNGCRPGEDASFTSFDDTRVSARLYLPAPALNYTGPRPVVYYIHGGPQGQERPDFAWFSMPLIQFLTLNGFAVFVPNVRGSTGYGLSYTKQVDQDWGGKDRLDHRTRDD